MTDGQRILTIPRHNPVNAFTMGGIIPTPDSPSSNSENCFERLQPMPRGLYDARSGVGLLVCVIAGANQRTGLDMAEAHLEGFCFEEAELVGRV